MLGRGKNKPSTLLTELEDKLHDRAISSDTEKFFRKYDFKGSGISLHFNNELEMFLCCELFTAVPFDDPVSANSLEPYAGNLPFNIQRLESRKSINAKAPGIIYPKKNYDFDLDLRPFELNCLFYNEVQLQKIEILFDSNFQSLATVSIEWAK